MASQKQLSNLMLLLRGGVGNVANARRQGPYENERSMFANKPLLTPKPMTAPDHRAAPPRTPLPAYRPQGGGGGGGGKAKPRIPVPLPRPPDPDPYHGAANTPDPYRNFPLPVYPDEGPGGGTRTGQRYSDPGGPGGGTLTGQRYSDPGGPGGGTLTGQRFSSPGGPGGGTLTGQAPPGGPGGGIVTGQPYGGPGGGTQTGQAGSETLYQNTMPNVPTPGRQPPGGPGGGTRTGQDWPAVAELPPAGGDPNAPNWWQHGSRYAQTMPNAESQRTPYQNSMPNTPDTDPWRNLNIGGGLMGLLQKLARGAGYVHF